MFNILPRLEAEFPWLHTRAGTEKDAFEFCERYRIHVEFQPDFPAGVWVKAGDDHFFLINSLLRGWLLTYVLFHEIGHYLFHVPTQSNFAVEFCDPHIKRKNHLEAEQTAALILLPTVEVENIYQLGAEHEFRELENLLKVRADLKKEHNIP
jgi:hypothetical protein